jgi:hypothetical protein
LYRYNAVRRRLERQLADAASLAEARVLGLDRELTVGL